MKILQKRTKTTTTLDIYIIRHGETAWSLSGQHTSFTDLPLTKKGRKEASSLKTPLKNLSFDTVFCSPLKRAFDTCKLAGFGTQFLIDHDLVEWNYGAYEGLTSVEIRKTKPNWTLFSEAPPGGETQEEVSERADRVLERLLAYKGRVALFSSGHFSRVLLMRWVSLPISYGGSFPIATASLTRLGFDRGKRVLLGFNKTF